VEANEAKHAFDATMTMKKMAPSLALAPPARSRAADAAVIATKRPKALAAVTKVTAFSKNFS
jgi:hypothetical protein